ncbi:MAG: hypothetical protein ACM3MB_08155 [Acidobacteriota bacterium]
MHTDEYEISLARELNACEKKIAKIKKTLLHLEKKYNIKAEVLADKFPDGNISEQDAGLIACVKESEALKKWEALRDQYAELLRKMKV